MTTIRFMAVLTVLVGATVALVPVGMLGAVYAVLSACALLALVPVAVENLMGDDLVEAYAR